MRFSVSEGMMATVCAAYLHKFFQVDLIAVEDIDPKETIQEIRVDFEGYAAVRYTSPDTGRAR